MEKRSSPVKEGGVESLVLADNKGIAKRALVRYFTTRNPERTQRMYERTGMQHLGNAIIKLADKTTGSSSIFKKGNYGLDPRKHGKLEAAAQFAYKGSVINELVHSSGAVLSALIAVGYVMSDGDLELGGPICLGVAAWNLALTGLQRCNRAKTLGMIDRSLKRGAPFDPEYENWAGVDGVTQDYLEQNTANAAPAGLADDPNDTSAPFVNQAESI